MIGLDTNILVRLITQDGLEAVAVSHFLESRCTEDEPGFIPLIVLCELVWVLDRAYGYTRTNIGEIVTRVLETDVFLVESADLAWNALKDYQNGPADFADYLIAHSCRQQGALPVATLDKKAARSPLFHLVTPDPRPPHEPLS